MNRKRVIVSAPGKVILFGEHSVVYGKLAVAAAIDKRLFISLEESNENIISIKLEGFESENKLLVLDTVPLSSYSEKLFETLAATNWSVKDISNGSLAQPPEFLMHSFREFFLKSNREPWMENIEKYLESHSSYQSANSAVRAAVFLFVVGYLIILVYSEKTYRGLCVTVQSQIPVGAGLGSSASYSVSLITSLLVFSGNIQIEDSLGTCMLEAVNRWAFVCETFLHGTPSGMDNTVATFGGFLSYRNGNKETFQIHSSATLRLIVVDSGIPRSTQKMVSLVRQRYERFPEIVSPILSSMDEIAIRFVQSAAASDLVSDSFSQQLAILMKTNHYLLNALGVGHPRLEEILSIAQHLGFEGAKLTGAGGGGCVVVLVDAEKSQVDALFHTLQSTFRCFEIVLGGTGVQIHQPTNNKSCHSQKDIHKEI
jgi:mevalonate kinase